MKIDFQVNENDWTVLALAIMGFSNQCIMDYTGYTSGQVNYRIKKGEVSNCRRDYRNGKTDIAYGLMQIGLGNRDAKLLVQTMHCIEMI